MLLGAGALGDFFGHTRFQRRIQRLQRVLGLLARAEILEQHSHLLALRRFDAKRGKLEPAARRLKLLFEPDGFARQQHAAIQFDPAFGLFGHHLPHLLADDIGNAGVQRIGLVRFDMHVIAQRPVRSIEKLNDAEAFVDRVEQGAIAQRAFLRVLFGADAPNMRPGPLRHGPDDRELLRHPDMLVLVVDGHQGCQLAVPDQGHTERGGNPDGLKRLRLFRLYLGAIVIDDQRRAGAQIPYSQIAKIAQAVTANNAARSRRRPIAANGEAVFILVHVGIGAHRYVQELARQFGGDGEHGVRVGQELRGARQFIEEGALLFDARLFRSVRHLHENTIHGAACGAHGLIDEIDDTLFCNAIPVQSHRHAAASIGLAALAHLVEKSNKALRHDFRQRLGGRLADNFRAPADKFDIGSVRALKPVLGPAQDRDGAWRLRKGFTKAIRFCCDRTRGEDVRGRLISLIENTRDFSIGVKDRGDAVIPVGLLHGAAALNRQHLVIRGKAHALLKNGLELLADHVPDIVPDFTRRASQRPGMALRRDD